ncbi:MAG: excinuclease ABC subunit UvrB [bacterium]|nr:excinuclease ABC subunit UvrB [bacterium]
MFSITSPFQPTGDQPKAIEALTKGLGADMRKQTLLGVTGSGKTFTAANIIQNVQRPTLVISPNKTLAAQLASEFSDFFPEAAVNYFVSYYDYYQPEAYLPQTDTYIAKDASINDEIDRLRHAATQAILSRNDVIIVASVSCIYGLGKPDVYGDLRLTLEHGQSYSRKKILSALNELQYQRNDLVLKRGTFQIKGDVLTLYPPFTRERLVRISFFGDTIERIEEVDAINRNVLVKLDRVVIFPSKHYLAPTQNIMGVAAAIRDELQPCLAELEKNNKLVEAQRLRERTEYDLEMMVATGYCSGIENYSRYFDGRAPGESPFTLIDYFRYAYKNDWLLFIDESHITVPQIGGMYEGDRSRKKTLINFGFRLPSALDNRPLTFDEFEVKTPQTIYTSATPGHYEFEHSLQVVEQIIRPTGLLDPDIEIRKTEGQIDDLIREIKARIANGQRVLVTTLTKRTAEDLADFLADTGIKAYYLHSDMETFERLEVLRDLRLGTYDVVVGINLLREGLDLPEVSLVVILDADKEGFLRSDRSLIQTMGRAARHVEGHVIMYADHTTGSMKRAMEETKRRRAIQERYNTEHGITPTTIIKAIREDRLGGKKKDEEVLIEKPELLSRVERERIIGELMSEMEVAAANLEFERAVVLRDTVARLKKGAIKKERSTA